MDIRSLPDEAFTAAALKRDRRRLETALFWGGVFVGLMWLVSLAELVAECEQGLAYLKRSHQPSIEAMLRFGVLHGALALLGRTPDARRADTPESSASTARSSVLSITFLSRIRSKTGVRR